MPLGFVGHYKNGVPSGYCWKGLLGGAWIYGMVDHDGGLTGHNISYINQDMVTAFKGQFINGLMQNAKPVEIVGVNCNLEGIKILQFSPSSFTHTYHFERPTSITFGDQPNIVDPLDGKYLRLGESIIETSELSQNYKENGVFANIDIPPNTVIAHNNGYIKTTKEVKMMIQKIKESVTQIYNKNETDKIDEQVRLRYLTEIGKYSSILKCSQYLIMPFEAGQDSKVYCGTYGHKINHSFSHGNVKLMFYDSARFGIVQSLMTRDGIYIPKGAEVLTQYGYTYKNSPSWYQIEAKEFLFGKDNPSSVIKDKVKNCYFVNSLHDDADRCEYYLYNLKNELLKTWGSHVTSSKDVSNENLDAILQKYHYLFQLPIIQSVNDLL